MLFFLTLYVQGEKGEPGDIPYVSTDPYHFVICVSVRHFEYLLITVTGTGGRTSWTCWTSGGFSLQSDDFDFIFQSR